jgi:hypothetical protein
LLNFLYLCACCLGRKNFSIVCKCMFRLSFVVFLFHFMCSLWFRKIAVLTRLTIGNITILRNQRQYNYAEWTVLCLC